MERMKFLVLILLITINVTCDVSSPVQCIDHYLYFEVGKEYEEVVCWNTATPLTVNPSLPKGLYFVNNTIVGQATSVSTLRKYSVVGDEVVGVFWLAVTNYVTYISVGFTDRVIYRNCLFSPISIISDGVLTNLKISPRLPSGIVLDLEKRRITGIYNSTSCAITYEMSVSYGGTEVSTKFVLRFADLSKVTHSIAYCIYPLGSLSNHVQLPSAWYDYNNPASCSSTTSLVNSAIIQSYTTTRYVGYLHLQDTREYTFRAVFCSAVRVLLDEEQIIYSYPNSTHIMDSSSLYLEAGYYLLQVFSIQHSDCINMQLFYSSEQEEWHAIKGEDLVDGAISPYHIQAPSLVSYAYHSIQSQPPTINGYPCTEYRLQSDLPTGLLFNSTSGVVYGMASQTGYFLIPLECYSPMGISSTKLPISIASAPKAGLQVTYYYNSNTFALATIESSIDHPIVAVGVTWPSLPLRLFRGFTAIWNGLYYVNKRGVHIFRFVVAGAVSVLIDTHVCTGRYTNHPSSDIYECSYSFSTGGYYSLSVTYSYSGQESGIQFFIKLPDSSQYISPKSYVFTEIGEVFRYSTKQMLCVVNTTIPSNSPIFNNHVPSSFTYSSIPELPEGLSISNGVIVGIPLVIVESGDYTIIATSQGTVLTTVVTIEVQPAEVPSSILIYDLLGRIYTSLSVFQYAFIPPLQLRTDIENVIWKFSSALPDGIILDNSNYYITGRAKTLFPNTTLVLEAQASGGEYSINFPVEVKGCEYGQFIYTSFSDYSSGKFVMKDGNMTIYNEDIVTGDYGLVMCLKKKQYDIEILCNNLDNCVFNLYREDGLCLLMEVIPPAKWNYYTLEEEDTNPPVIIMKTPTVVTRVNIQFHVYFMVEHPFYEIVFRPSLPSSIQFDQHRLRLYGSYSSSAVLKFTVTAHNDHGSHELPFSIYVDHCSGNSQLYRISRSTSELSESMKIVDQSVNVIHEILFSGEAYDNFVCLEPQVYSVVLLDCLSMGWVPGSDVVIRDSQNRTYTTFLLDARQDNITDILDLRPILQENSTMRYLVSALAPAYSWKTLVYDDTNWSLSESPHWKSIPASLATVYFRTIVNIDKGSLAIHVFFKEGCIVYIDGNELDRFNLPTGAIYHSTTASSQFSSSHWITLFTPYYRTSSQVIIAVEIHRYYVVSSAHISFDLFVTHNLSPQLLVSFEGEGTPSTAFDGQRNHFWNTTLPAMAGYSFKNHRHYAINRIDIAVGPHFLWNAPTAFSLYGLTDKGELLTSFYSKSFFHYPYDVVSLYFLTSLKAYSRYDLLFTGSLNNESIDIHAIAFYIATTVECMGNEHWQETFAGNTVTGACRTCMIGKSRRECSRYSLTGEWKEPSYSFCVSKTPHLGFLFLDTTIVVMNVTGHLWHYNFEELFRRAITHKIQLEDFQLVLLPYGDCSTDVALLFEVGIRVDVKKKFKSEVYHVLADIKNVLNEELVNMGITTTSVVSAEQVLIRDSTSVVILLCILFVCMVGFAVGVFLLLRQWKKKQMQVTYLSYYV